MVQRFAVHSVPLATSLLVALAGTSVTARPTGEPQACGNCHYEDDGPSIDVAFANASPAPGETTLLTITLQAVDEQALRTGVFIYTEDRGAFGLVEPETTRYATDGDPTAVLHSAPRELDAEGRAQFQFEWTAPDEVGVTDFTVWSITGNSNGNSADESASSAGAVYVYLRDGVTWSQVAYLKASNTGAGDSFGQVALSQDTLAVGAPGEASDATGVNGDASSNAAAASGAVYVFDVGTLAPGRIFCSGDGSGSACPCGNSADSRTRTGCLNSLGNGARLRATGSRHLGYDTLVLHGSQMTDGPCVYLQNTTALAGTGGWGVAFGDGLRCLGSGTVFLGRVRNVAGASRWPAIGDVPISIHGGVLAPGTRNYQVWYRDSASFCSAETFNLSNAVSIDWIP